MSHMPLLPSILGAVTVRSRSVWLLGIQLLLFESALAVWALDIRQVWVVQTLFILSIVTVSVYSLACVPVPSFFHYFVASFILLFMLFPLASPLLDLEFTGDPSMGLYTLMTVGGLHAFVATYEITRRRFRALAPVNLDRRRLELAVWGFLGLNLLAIALAVVDAGSLSALSAASRVERKLSFDRLSLAIVFALNFGSVVYALLPAYLSTRRSLAIPIALVLLVVEVGAFLAFRARSTMVNHMVAFGVGAVFLVPPSAGSFRRSARASWKRTMALAGIAAVVLTSAVVLRFFRGTFEEAGLSGAESLVATQMIRRSFENGDLGYTPNTLSVMNEVPRYRDYLYGQSYYRLLFVPIPRTIWPDKPENTQRIIAQWIAPELVEQTIPPGIQGDLYINFGLIGFFGFFVFGAGFALLDRGRGLFQGILVAAGFMPTFHIVRGALTNPLMLLAAIATSAWILARFVEAPGRAAPTDT